MAKLAAAKEFAYMKALKDSLALMTWNASCLGISMLTFAGRGISCSHSYRSKPPCCGDVFREALRSTGRPSRMERHSAGCVPDACEVDAKPLFQLRQLQHPNQARAKDGPKPMQGGVDSLS